MRDYFNPFEYEAANKLTPAQILDFYIEDFNYSRFIRSRRNIMLVGERGTGKTMTLRYNSFPVQLEDARRRGTSPDLSLVCVYVPCNTPLTYKPEYQLLADFQALVVSEHFLVLSIMYAIADTLSSHTAVLEGADENRLKEEIEYVLGLKVPQGKALFDGLRLAFQSEVAKAQRALNARTPNAFYNEAASFSSGVLPLISCLRGIPALGQTHFALMLDDAHDLNLHQVKSLNSWIAYRDNTLFSFKVATAKVDRPAFITASGGTILEGHDFTLVDMEQPYQSQYSDFGKLARQIVKRRLDKINFQGAPEDFFPVNSEFDNDLEKCREQAKKDAAVRFPNATPKQIEDYVYKQARAEYFRQRSSKANRPPYSGFDILVHLSTGVIRNLLEPCYWMYDMVVSDVRAKGQDLGTIGQIPPSVQTGVILQRSERKWEWIRNGLDNSIENCSPEDAKRIYRLFDQLAILFRERLLHHKSEPRAIAFTVSDTQDEHFAELQHLLEIARKAQILYAHPSSAKDYGRREMYYIPNRMLWPVRGLDPHGQHARVSLQVRHLWAAAAENKRIPFGKTEEGNDQGLFNGTD